MTSFVRRWVTEEGDTYVVALVRVLMGGLLLYSALRETLRAFQNDHFANVFHLPLVPEAMVPPAGVWWGVVALQIVLGGLVVVGYHARPALFLSALLGVYALSCDRLGYHNNRYALCLFAFLLAFAPCDRAFVLTRRALSGGAGESGAPLDQRALSAEERRGPLWAVRLAQLQMSVIYVASGGSKLLDPDWRDGLVLGDRLTRATSMAVAKGVPAELMALLADPGFSSGLAKLAIATELVLAVTLFLPRTRAFALWWGTMFHLTIEVTSQVEIFTWLSLTIYALFAIPAVRERTVICDPSSPRGRAVARIVRFTDWLARFEVRREAVDGSPFAVIGRDGSRAEGLRGYARLARALPIFFPLAFPLWVVARVRGRPAGDARATAW